ncbi:MAG: glycosyltransferase [Halobacteriota archaeon]
MAWNVTVMQPCRKLFLSNTPLSALATLNKKDPIHNRRFISKTFNVIKDCNPDSFVAAARKINDSKISVVNIQHEFGLYRGDFGAYLLEFLREVRKPVVTTFHTVLPNPPLEMKKVVREIYNLSDRIIVSAQTGINILRDTFGLDKSKLTVIPHGVPDVPFVKTEWAKRYLGLSGKFVIGSYGLINPDKGIEYVLEALPSVIERNSEKQIVYMVVGELHPGLDQRLREAYREKLETLIRELNLSRNVLLVDRYLSNREMIMHFLATDVCAVTNMNANQISSGVLSQAIGCGKSIIATKFAHAAEALSNGRGLFVEFGDAGDIAHKLNELVRDEALRAQVSRDAYLYGRSMTWDKIARKYVDIFAHVREPQMRTPASMLVRTSLARRLEKAKYSDYTLKNI